MGLVAAFIVLFICEGAARIVKTVLDDARVDERDWYVYSAEVGWKPRPNAFDMPPHVRRHFDAKGFFVEDTKRIWDQSGKPRVIGVGDSTMYGFGVATKDTYMELLNKRIPGANFINLAVPGYSSCNGYYRLITDGMPLKPSLILASFNFNDRRYMVRPEDVDSPRRFAELARDQALINVTRRVYLLRAMYFGLRLAHIMPERDEPGRLDMHADYVGATNVDLGATKARVEPGRYREYLEKIVATGRDHKIPVVFIMTGDNPGWMAPIRKALDLKAAGKYQDAIKELKNAIYAKNAFSPQARVELSRVYELAGDPQKAKNARTEEHPFNSLLGGYTIYRDDEYQAIMREVAGKNNIPLVDARMGDRPDVFMDFCHFNEGGHGAVALMVEKVLRDNHLVPAQQAGK